MENTAETSSPILLGHPSEMEPSPGLSSRTRSLRSIRTGPNDSTSGSSIGPRTTATHHLRLLKSAVDNTVNGSARPGQPSASVNTMLNLAGLQWWKRRAPVPPRYVIDYVWIYNNHISCGCAQAVPSGARGFVATPSEQSL